MTDRTSLPHRSSVLPACLPTAIDPTWVAVGPEERQDDLGARLADLCESARMAAGLLLDSIDDVDEAAVARLNVRAWLLAVADTAARLTGTTMPPCAAGAAGAARLRASYGHDLRQARRDDVLDLIDDLLEIEPA